MLVLGMAVLSLSVPSSYGQSSEMLVVHFDFDGDALDSSSYENDGETVNSPAFVATSEDGGYAIRLNGEDQHVSASGDLLNFENDFTITSRMRTLASTTQYIIFKGDFASASYSLRIDADGRPSAEISDGKASAVAVGNISVNNGNWQHVSASFDRDGYLRVFVNGTATGEPAALSSINDISGNGDLLIGARNNGGVNQLYFNGDIDDVRIYNEAFVQIPITLSMRGGSNVDAESNFTITGHDCIGNHIHNANPPTQNFLCPPLITIAITVPPDMVDTRYRFANGLLTQDFKSCSSGICDNEVFEDVTKQVTVTVNADGMDEAQRIGISRTQLGKSGTDYVRVDDAGSEVWVDRGGSLSFPEIVQPETAHYSVVPDANQGMYSSSMTRVGMYVTASSELVGKEVDSIVLKLDKVGQPDGTVHVRVRDLNDNIVRELGSIAASSLSPVPTDFLLTTSHVFRSDEGILIEYDSGDRENRVRLWFSTTDQFDGAGTFLIGYGNSTYFSFKENDLGAFFGNAIEEERFVASSTRVFTIFEPSVKTVSYEKQLLNPDADLDLQLFIPRYQMVAGETLTQNIEVAWKGSKQLAIASVTFDSNAGWFKVEKPAQTVVASIGDVSRIALPLTVSIPVGAEAGERMVNAKVVVADEQNRFRDVTVPVEIVVEGTVSYTLYLAIAIVSAIAIGVVILRFRRR